MDDLVARVDLVDRELMKEIRGRLGGGASINAVLDAARDINTRRYAQQLILHNCDSIFAMVEYIHDIWELNVVDTRAVLGRVCELTKDPTLKAFLDAELVESVWKYTKLDAPPPKCCFTWGRSRRPCRTRKTRPPNCPSPGTGKAGTGQ